MSAAARAAESDEVPGWAAPAMRIGAAGRALVYAIVGVLAVLAAVRGGEADGTSSVLEQLRGSPWGLAALALISLGMLAYAVWRIEAAVHDLDAHGGGFKGAAARISMVVTGLLHAGIGLYAAALLVGLGHMLSGGDGGGEGGGARSITAFVMSQPFGVWIVGAAGLCILAAGFHYMRKGAKETYRRKIHDTRLTRGVAPILRFGLIAHGFVVLIIGGFVVWAAWTYDPSQAGGLGQAFEALRSQPFGRVLLGVVALGLVAFAFFCLVEAVYGLIPRGRDDGMPSLAERMEREAGRAGA